MNEKERMEQLMATMNGSYYGMSIPEKRKEQLARYIVYHIEPGGFLSSLLENNLQDAVGMADDVDMPNIAAYVIWLYNNAPIICWGSPEKVRGWCENYEAIKV